YPSCELRCQQRLAHDLWRCGSHRKQRLRRPARLATALLPVLQRAHGDAEHPGELELRHPELEAGLGGFRDRDGKPASTTGLDLADGLQDFGADIALCITFADLLRQLLHGFTSCSFNARMTCAGRFSRCVLAYTASNQIVPVPQGIGSLRPCSRAQAFAISYPASACRITPVPGSFHSTRAMRRSAASVPSETMTLPQ